MIEDELLSEIRLNKHHNAGREDAVGLSLKCFNNLSPSFNLEYTFYESLSTFSPSIARPFLEACYDRVVQ